MTDMDQDADRCLTMLQDMEHNWEAAVNTAMAVRQDQLYTAHKVILDLRHQVKHQQSLIRLKDGECNGLSMTVADLKTKLDSSHAEVNNLMNNLEITQRQMEERNIQHRQELERNEMEVEDMRIRQTASLKDLAEGARETLRDLENQFEEVKKSEYLYQKRISELEELNNKTETRLLDWNRVSEQMCSEISDVKDKLRNSKYANSKLREEMALWKKYCDKLEDEKKTTRKEKELEKKLQSQFTQVESFLKTERLHRNLVLDLMNRFGENIKKEIMELRNNSKPNVVVESVGSQTDVVKGKVKEYEDDEEGRLIMIRREMQLEDDLKKTLIDLENLSQQNMTLREVIKSMKKEREGLENEKEQREGEARVARLEETVRQIKNNLTQEQKDLSVWNALQGVKKEVTNLKNQTLNKTTKKEGAVKPGNKLNPGFIIKQLGK